MELKKIKLSEALEHMALHGYTDFEIIRDDGVGVRFERGVFWIKLSAEKQFNAWRSIPIDWIDGKRSWNLVYNPQSRYVSLGVLV